MKRCGAFPSPGPVVLAASCTLPRVPGFSSLTLWLLSPSCGPARGDCGVGSTSVAPVGSGWLDDHQSFAGFAPDPHLLGVALRRVALGAPHLVGWNQLEAVWCCARAETLHVYQLVCAFLTPIRLSTALVRASNTFASEIGTCIAHLPIYKDQASAPSDAGEGCPVAVAMGSSWWVCPFICRHLWRLGHVSSRAGKHGAASSGRPEGRSWAQLWSVS